MPAEQPTLISKELDHIPANINRTVPNPLLYGIDFETGFMPNPPPLRSLPEYYAPWEKLMASFNALILSSKIRAAVKNVFHFNPSYHY